MTRENLKDLVELIGFAAIVASLIFVGIETRNSTKQAILTTQALEISAYQDMIDNISEMNVTILDNPELNAFMHRAVMTDDELTEEERFRFRRSMFIRFRHGDMAFFQYQRGAFNEARLRSVLMVLRLGNPRVQEEWEAIKHVFVPEYRDFIERLIAERKAEEAT